MLELRLNANERCIHYFFETDSNSSSSLNGLYRALIKQLITQFDCSTLTLPKNCSTAVKSVFKLHGIPPDTEDLLGLLKLLIDSFPPSLYLIDGFDDLDELQIQDMFSALRGIFSDQNLHHSKLVLVSREILGRGIDVEHQTTGLLQVHTIRLTLSLLRRDIGTFVEAQVNEQQLRRKITENESLIKDIKKSLKANSEKM